MRNAVTYLKSWFGRFDAVRQRRPDPWLWLPAMALVLLGCLMVLNTTYFMSREKTGDAFHFFKLHLLHLGVGFLMLTALSQFSLRGLRRLVFPLLIASCALLLMLHVPGLGIMRGGARRWLRLGPYVCEPVEFVKLAVVFFLADFLSKREDRMRILEQGPLPALAIVGMIAAAVLIQPDLGNTVMIAIVLFVMLYAAGAQLKHLGIAGALGACLLVAQMFTKSYRARRITAFLHPWETAKGPAFQLIQSFIALGTGGGWGVGLGEDRQKMYFLPQAHTDFVFAVVGEEFGVIGAVIVTALFCVILFRGMKIAHDEPDSFASLLAVGLTASLSFQAFINMGMVIGLLPTKGLPLPFLSYGGTAIMMSMAALGALLALGRRPAVR